MISRICRWDAVALLGLIALVQARIFGMFDIADLEGADSAFAIERLNAFYDWPPRLDMVWEPLFTAFLFLFRLFTSDAHFILLGARAFSIMAATGLIYAVGRRILKPFWACALAIWWLALPHGIAPDFTKHVFQFAALLLGAWLALRADRPKIRLALCALLLVYAALLRNEYALLAIIFVGAAIMANGRPSLAQLRPYAILFAFLGTAFAALWAYSASTYYASHDPAENVKGKHVLNACQVYAYGFFQRNPQDNIPPDAAWDEDVCQDLVQKHFGQTNASMLDMALANPAALFAHYAWNVRLVPPAIEAVLFGRYTAGEPNPGYEHRSFLSTSSWPRYALWAWCAFIAVSMFSLKAPFSWRSNPWLCWYFLGAAAVIFIVLLTQRPRPVFLLFLGFGLSLVTLIYAQAWAERFSRRAAAVLSRPWAALVAVGLAILVAPDHYRAFALDYGKKDGRIFYDQYRSIAPHFKELSQGQSQHRWLLLPGPSHLVFAYLMTGARIFDQKAFSYKDYPSSWDADRVVLELDKNGVNLVYIDVRVARRLGLSWAQGLPDILASRGWQRLDAEGAAILLVAPLSGQT